MSFDANRRECDAARPALLALVASVLAVASVYVWSVLAAASARGASFHDFNSQPAVRLQPCALRMQGRARSDHILPDATSRARPEVSAEQP